VAKSTLTLLALSVASVLLGIQAMGQVSGAQQSSLTAPFAGSPLTCSQTSQPEKFVVPKSVEKRAKLKARLLNLLHESLYDDSKGIVNVAREKEIASLANKLKQASENPN
jgi:hypothetical protein